MDGVFWFTGAGAVRLVPLDGRIVASSRTYTQAAGGRGTVGQSIPAILTETGRWGCGESRITGRRRSPNPSRGFRTNLGFVNLTGAALALRVELERGDATPLGSFDLLLPPFAYLQHTDALAPFSDFEIADGQAVITAANPAAAYVAYASVIDNRTADPTFQLAVPARSTCRW